jgi:DNA gyrase subunit A
MKVYEITEGEKSGKGRAIQNLIQIPPDDKIKAIIDVKRLEDKEFVESHYIVLCTKRGIIKKTSLADFSRPRANGVNAITINEGDELLEAKMTDGNNEIMMAIKSGRAIRFPESKVRPTGRGAIGVGGIEVDDTKDEVVGMICVNLNDISKNVLVISENGYGKRTAVDEYRITNRGGKGVKTINVTEKTGMLIGIMDVSDKEDLIVTCKSGITLRTSLASIKESGRATQGVKIIRVDEKDSIAAISKIEETEEPVVVNEDGAQAESEVSEITSIIITEVNPANISPEPEQEKNNETESTENQ